MTDWQDEAANWLDRFFGDPMADAVAGVASVLRVSDQTGRRRYQECELDLVVEAPGLPTAMVTQRAMIDRRHWPTPGTALPARVSVSHPGVIEVDWDALAS